MSFKDIQGGQGNLLVNLCSYATDGTPIPKQRFKLGEVKDLSAKLEIKSTTIRVLGEFADIPLATGGAYSGECTVYKTNSSALQILKIIKETGMVPEFEMEILSYAGMSTKPTGKHESVTLKGCLIDGLDLVSLSAENNPTERKYGFKFVDAEINNMY